MIDKEPQFNAFWYFVLTFFICGGSLVVWYLCGIGL